MNIELGIESATADHGGGCGTSYQADFTLATPRTNRGTALNVVKVWNIHYNVKGPMSQKIRCRRKRRRHWRKYSSRTTPTAQALHVKALVNKN